MDEKMKGNVIALLVVGCFALGLMGQFGGTWLTDSETDADTGITSESEYGLHEVTTTLSGDADTVTAMEGMLDTASPGWNEINFADKYENCTEELDAARANAKAAGATDEMFEEGAKDNIDDCNDVGAMADAGSYGGMTLWVATVAALIAAIVVMAGMSGGIDALPEQTGMIAQWAAGALT
ncbi:MAG: hypothetical protein QF707_06405, partial [Candidatus Poseidoniaceae archaeon]|nr:hypothetical protein [Candidatus Poseidoniaceae archaeon]